jgi:hypothetical protein
MSQPLAAPKTLFSFALATRLLGAAGLAALLWLAVAWAL